MHALTLPLSALALGLAGCASAYPPEAAEADPFEGFNRSMYAFNDGLDQAVLEPAARGYRAVTNEPVRAGVRNFVQNLGEPVTFANEVLQGKLPRSAATVGRFAINTTVGVAGIFDPAAAIGIPRTNEDFGQTLGVWGIAGGPYLVLPLLGPSNPRDLFGVGVDAALNPLNYAQFEGDTETRIGLGVMAGLSGREGAIETVDDIRATQLDPYTTVRRFYVRNRAAEIGNPSDAPEETEELPDYELDF
jgi:phospholipid-binding lipoprotein MlaA